MNSVRGTVFKGTAVTKLIWEPNVASMPLDASSTFIRSSRGGGYGGGGGGLVNSLGPMLAETKGCGR